MSSPEQHSKVLLLDGGFSNTLNKYCTFDVHQEGLWTAQALISEHSAIIKAHLDYLEAGVDILETSSYQASLPGFKECLNLDNEEGEKLIRTSVNLAKQALEQYWSTVGEKTTRTKPLIAGSVGPYGAYLRDGSEYTGNYVENVTVEQMREFHLPRLEFLIDEGVDLLAVETNPSVKEVETVLTILKEKFPQTKAWVSFSMNATVDNHSPLHSICGDSLKIAFETLFAKFGDQLWGFGVNCTTPEDISPFLKEVSKAKQAIGSSTKLVVYPNSGQKWNSGTGWSSKDSVPTLASYVKEWIHLGANVIGGCCQIEPDDIKSIRPVIDEWNSKDVFKNV